MKNIVLIFVFLFATATHAGLRDFCVNFFAVNKLVQEDPYPYAEYTNQELIGWFRMNRDPEIKKEIIFRIENGMMHRYWLGLVME